MRRPLYALALLSLLVPAAVEAADNTLRDNPVHVRRWNDFADQLMKIHRHWLATLPTVKKEEVGGYARRPKSYVETTYSDPETGRVRSRIRWLTAKPDLAHVIDIFFYDKAGRVIQDFTATYLMDFRNAPVQTLINLHFYDGELHAFRQFDASGNRIYEACRGRHFDKPVDISLDEGDIPPSPADETPELYLTCFGFLPTDAGKYLHPAFLVPGLDDRAAADGVAQGIDHKLAQLEAQIALKPEDPKLYIERGKANFVLNRFDEAVADFTKAIALDPSKDAAYFGRGLALGRAGQLSAGIADLTVYIERNPKSSVAYTKRGVRHIWNRDFVAARRDLERAVALDDSNAEAHDDLGVVLAQTGNPAQAIPHFEKARRLDPGYQKPHHNLAMALYMVGQFEPALAAVDEAIRLDERARGTLMLKGTILDALGRADEARAIREAAEFLPEGNWSERSGLQ